MPSPTRTRGSPPRSRGSKQGVATSRRNVPVRAIGAESCPIARTGTLMRHQRAPLCRNPCKRKERKLRLALTVVSPMARQTADLVVDADPATPVGDIAAEFERLTYGGFMPDTEPA